MIFGYNADQQLISVTFDEDQIDDGETPRFEYGYNAWGRIAFYQDHLNDNTWYYTYTEDNQISTITDQYGNIIGYGYDEDGLLVAYDYRFEHDGQIITRAVSYTYDNEQKLTETSYMSDSGEVNLSHVYDSDHLNRYMETIINLNQVEFVSVTYDYDDNDVIVDPGDSGLSERVNGITYHYRDATGSIHYKYVYVYTYDGLGNLTMETLSLVSILPGVPQTEMVLTKHTYAYDALNQLIREDLCTTGCETNPSGETTLYQYDDQGNRTITERYAYTVSGTAPDTSDLIETVTFTMTESWSDQLSSAYGNTYTYDAQGNVLTKTHVQSGHVTSYAWEGRTLVGIVVKDENGVTMQEVTYTYDDQGIRTSKTVGGVLHTYVTDGFRVLVETWGNNTIQYTYDLSGRIISAMINGTEYFYQYNIQGDVTALALSSGVVVVRYVYDAWGNVVAMSGSLSSTIGEINSVRYRGYTQDSETGFHYLQSRYYDPMIGRFISSDGWLGEPGMVLSHNMYVYALNNPVMYTDSTGYAPEWLNPSNWSNVTKIAIGVAIIVALAVATVATGGAAGGVAGYILAGALQGAVIGAVSGGLISGTINGVSSGSWQGFADGLANGFMTGAIIGGVTGAASNAFKVAKAAQSWNGAGRYSPYKDMVRHYQRHVINEGQQHLAGNIVNYTKHANKFFASDSTSGYLLREGVMKIAGAPGGIYTTGGKILSYWYIGL